MSTLFRPRRQSNQRRVRRNVSWCVVMDPSPWKIISAGNIRNKVGGFEDIYIYIYKYIFFDSGDFQVPPFNFQGCIVKFMNSWWIWIDLGLGFMN